MVHLLHNIFCCRNWTTQLCWKIFYLAITSLIEKIKHTFRKKIPAYTYYIFLLLVNVRPWDSTTYNLFNATNWYLHICTQHFKPTVFNNIISLFLPFIDRMEAIKKKVQNMKVEKDNLCDRMDAVEEVSILMQRS